MNDIILSRGARAPPGRMMVVLSAEGRQIRRRLAKNLVRSAQLTVLALQLLEPKALLAREPCTAPAVARHSRGSGNRPDVPTCVASAPCTRASTKPRGSPTTANHVHPGAPTPGAPPVPGFPGSILSVISSALSSQRLNECSLRETRGGSPPNASPVPSSPPQHPSRGPLRACTGPSCPSTSPLPFTHFPTPPTTPSTSLLQAHLRIGKDFRRGWGRH